MISLEEAIDAALKVIKEEEEKSNTIKYLYPDLYEKEKQVRRENEKPWKIGGVIVKETGEND